jgi:hypothetical protein
VAEAAAADPSDPVPATLTTLADPERFEAARSEAALAVRGELPRAPPPPSPPPNPPSFWGDGDEEGEENALEVVSSAEAKTTKARAKTTKALAATVAWAAAVAAGASRRAY